MAEKQLKIAITGKMRAGKDTFAECLKEHQYFYEMKFSNGITDIIKAYFPDAFKQGKPRQHYQTIGQSFRQLNPDIWVQKLNEELRQVESLLMPQNLLVTDLRQQNEHEYLKEQGFIVVKVVADQLLRLQRIEAEADLFNEATLHHETEFNVDDIVADYTISNSGSLQELQEQGIELLQTLSGGC